MFRKFLVAGSIAIVLAFAGTVSAQDYKAEVTGFVGYSFSDGFTVDNVAIGGDVFNTISPVSGFSYGFTFGYFLNDNMEVGFLFGQQQSELEIKGPVAKESVTDLDVRNYHGVFTYNFGEYDSVVRPFFMGGIGATQYKPGDIMGNSVEGNTKLSTTWGGGVKLYPSEHVGIQAMARWTPTYIKSDPAGIWCSPYWPFACWPVSNAQYSNQFEFSAGVALRF